MSTPARKAADSEGRLSLRAAKRKVTQDRLVAAAAAAFEAKHYVDVTVDDISDRAGTSRATFYLYYPGKAKILTDCLREFDQGLAELWDLFEALDEVTLPALEDWLASYVELYEKHKLLLNTMDQAEAVEPEFRDKTIATAKDTIARWQRLDAVKSMMKPDDDLELRLLLFTAELQRFLSLWIIHGIAVDRVKAVRKLAEHWYAVLAGDR